MRPRPSWPRDEVIQTLPWNWRGWHAGSGKNGSANNTHISFECCEPAGHTYQNGKMVGYDVEKNEAYFQDIYRNAVELSAMLCRQYRLDPMEPGVILDHAGRPRPGDRQQPQRCGPVVAAAREDHG